MSALSYLLLKPLSAETSILVFGKSYADDQCGSIVLLLASLPESVFLSAFVYLLNKLPEPSPSLSEALLFGGAELRQIFKDENFRACVGSLFILGISIKKFMA